MNPDRYNMKKVLLNLPQQIEDASKSGLKARLKFPLVKEINNIVVCGMGGSAISGDLMNMYLENEIRIPILVNRGYDLPNFVNQNSLVFVVSYSGNTEETLNVYHKVIEVTKNVICITSGGKLESLNPPEVAPPFILKIPKGYQPRCAIGWMFVPMVIVLSKLGIISDKGEELNETVALLYKLGKEFSATDSPPLLLAKKIIGKLPIIYSDAKFSPVARRWVTQLNENSKLFAHFNTFPELTHNELVGFGNPALNSLVIILKDRGYNSRIQRQTGITKKMIAPYTEISEVKSQGTSLLARFFSLIYFGDWMSYWVAILTKVDPTPVERIEKLKKELAKR